ncbi:pseudouridylate synthase [Gracilibacillus halophilus YIM-C55.5]|uniref:tRNA pseudouridine synthase A n=1 Tax=Gracilibacillus halophilus YIM-C55.5 TaxID=1308866 RepID=N4WXJ0_9BACI|nr:tRNA pseudouridine(38-40) synthase TruA [Gracilibacillus halophilus]ENH97811.1 pseudouridylate synthase [Gracilibacillus halophilus YIM-C55.5]
MRMKAVIRYDGTHFSGYQIQPNVRTVQEELEKVLQKIHKGQFVRVHASGRTDQGVHAMGQVIHFDTDLSIPTEKWEQALNTMLPADIEVLQVSNVYDHFHARYDVKEKEYRYIIVQGKRRDLFRRHYVYCTPHQLDVKAMQEACHILEGTHDFSSFCGSNNNQQDDKVRTITEAWIDRDEDEFIFRVRGTGFLYNMVRIIVGTLLEIGRGERLPEELETILQVKNRIYAGDTAPAQGLYLWEVFYE